MIVVDKISFFFRDYLTFPKLTSEELSQILSTISASIISFHVLSSIPAILKLSNPPQLPHQNPLNTSSHP
jgi:hypothetical protein